ncbi:MAG UNVERIFIED_CONTAM: hypothetical protein LVQ98_05965 [Rickettsiaceae bacterium]|jgi:acyl-[acyl-carrier-protein]-phospholipid O-acyltransferase/long-chain-fatty-acid--[acyl-carrier-protein] ligase
MLLKSFILGKAFSQRTLDGEYVGLMLPNSVAGAISFFAMQAYGRVPAMINFTSGISNIISGCNTVKIRTIYTSRKFIAKAELDDLAENLEKHFEVIYLEDLAKKLE